MSKEIIVRKDERMLIANLDKKLNPVQAGIFLQGLYDLQKSNIREVETIPGFGRYVPTKTKLSDVEALLGQKLQKNTIESYLIGVREIGFSTANKEYLMNDEFTEGGIFQTSSFFADITLNGREIEFDWWVRDRERIEMLLGMSESALALDLSIALKLKKSLGLYELIELRQREHVTFLELSLESLFDLMKIKSRTGRRYSNFNRNHMKPAIEELNELTQYNVEHSPIKEDKTTVGVLIKWTTTKPGFLSTPSQLNFARLLRTEYEQLESENSGLTADERMQMKFLEDEDKLGRMSYHDVYKILAEARKVLRDSKNKIIDGQAVDREIEMSQAYIEYVKGQLGKEEVAHDKLVRFVEALRDIEIKDRFPYISRAIYMANLNNATDFDYISKVINSLTDKKKKDELFSLGKKNENNISNKKNKRNISNKTNIFPELTPEDKDIVKSVLLSWEGLKMTKGEVKQLVSVAKSVSSSWGTMLGYAINIANAQHKEMPVYVLGILENWSRAGVSTLDEAQEFTQNNFANNDIETLPDEGVLASSDFLDAMDLWQE